MIITLWGARGSLPCSGNEHKKYGGNTSCVEVKGSDDSLLVLDAGTGIRPLGTAINDKMQRVDILLTHLHLDHIQGLGFFLPLYNPNAEVHIYGPAYSEKHLRQQLSKYLSPPLFPVLLHDLPCSLYLHAVPRGEFKIGEFRISSEIVCHPGLTVGYHISNAAGSMAYMPDHEPALGVESFPEIPEWTSGYHLAANVDLLFHDAQYAKAEYVHRVGWGHSTFQQAIEFAKLANVKKLVTFHHDPAHNDKELDALLADAVKATNPPFEVLPGLEGSVFKL